MKKQRHVPSTLPYFRVSGGEKKEIVEDKETLLPSRTRFESLSLADAENFARGVYREENIVLEIHEVSRETV